MIKYTCFDSAKARASIKKIKISLFVTDFLLLSNASLNKNAITRNEMEIVKLSADTEAAINRVIGINPNITNTFFNKGVILIAVYTKKR